MTAEEFKKLAFTTSPFRAGAPKYEGEHTAAQASPGHSRSEKV